MRCLQVNAGSKIRENLLLFQTVIMAAISQKYWWIPNTEKIHIQ